MHQLLCVNLQTKDISHRVDMGYKKKTFTAPVGLGSYRPALQRNVMFFFRYPPPCKVDDMTRTRDYYTVISNCRDQEKAYTALENIQYFPDRYISYIWYHVPVELGQQHVSVQFTVTKSGMTVIWGGPRGEAFQLSTSQSRFVKYRLAKKFKT